MLATNMRTTTGQRRVELEEEERLCFAFHTKQFVVRCAEAVKSESGNGCLWVVIRDDNMLGDVDVVGAAAIPLVDTLKMAQAAYGKDAHKEAGKDVFVHFKRDVTYATCKRIP